MDRIDRLIWKELWPPFGSGVAMFAGLLFAAGMLVRITEWIVGGADSLRVLELSMLFMPAILVKCAAMATLFASLMAFGRLSNDSEIVALRAAGAGLFRVMRPVTLFALMISSIGFAINETVVPWGSERANSLQIDLRRDLDKGKAQRDINRTVKMKDGGFVFVNAMDFSLEKQTLYKASLLLYNKDMQATWWLTADELQFFGPKDWRVTGQATLRSADLRTLIMIKDGAWPDQIDNLDITPRNLFAGITSDLDVFSMTQIRAEIDRLRKEPNPSKSQINNLEFGYWNKIASPLACVVFGLLGAPLGISSRRSGKGSGFAISIGLTFAYLMLANFMSVYSRGGAIPPFVASFTPLLIGVVVAAITISRKNG